MSPFKSPPTKVRVGDKDQRVWNDDDDLVPDDVLYAVDWDDFDEDYEPPSNLENPWTRSLRTRGQRQGRVSIPEIDITITVKPTVTSSDRFFSRKTSAN